MLCHHSWFNPDQPELLSYSRISSFPHFLKHQWHRAEWDRRSHVQQHSLVFCCLAGCLHSAQKGWLIICQPLWGMRPTCQQQAQCFSGQRWRLESKADHSAAILQAKGGGRVVGGKEGKRDQGRAGGIPTSRSVFCNSHGWLGQKGRPLVACYVCQPHRINTGAKAQKHLNVQKYLFLHFRTCMVFFGAKNVHVFSVWEALCNNALFTSGLETNSQKSTNRT